MRVLENCLVKKSSYAQQGQSWWHSISQWVENMSSVLFYQRTYATHLLGEGWKSTAHLSASNTAPASGDQSLSCSSVSFSCFSSYIWQQHHVHLQHNQLQRFCRLFMVMTAALGESIDFQQRRSTCRSSRGLLESFVVCYCFGMNVCLQKKLHCCRGAIWGNRGDMLWKLHFWSSSEIIWILVHFEVVFWSQQVTNVVSSMRLNIGCFRPFTRQGGQNWKQSCQDETKTNMITNTNQAGNNAAQM